MTTASHSDQGFTLVEALVALVILASIAGMFQSNLGSGLAGLRIARLEAAAVDLARSKLAAAGIETPFVTGTTSGVTASGLSWTADLRPFTASSTRPDTDFESDQAKRRGLAPLWRATVTVKWREAPARKMRTLTLETLKLGAGPT
ncbi:MAG: prepilin-type N-terminal cleavage/methylation domain-containing protein [Hyphomicrobium sp.]|nr:prepilin-type N-terminal cleavage/methylation domain-containing protein [Hyphomicrobium sp.]